MMTTNVNDVLRLMESRIPQIQPALMQAARRIAPIVERDSRRVMQEDIYDIPEKRSRSGRLKWIRNVRLLMAERAEIEGFDVALVNRTEYAAPRYHLGWYNPGPPTLVRKGGGKARQVRPPQRSTQWQHKAIRMSRAFVLNTRRTAILRVFQMRPIGRGRR